MEQEVDIVENVKGDKTYYNLVLKTKGNNKGLDSGNHIIVEKVYVEGYEIDGKYGKVYSCAVKYKGKQCTFLLNAKDHDKWKNVGGIGDQVKITLNKEPFTNKQTGIEMLIPRLSFEMYA